MLCRSARLSNSNLRSLASALKYCASQAVSFPFTLYAALLQQCGKQLMYLMILLIMLSAARKRTVC